MAAPLAKAARSGVVRFDVPSTVDGPAPCSRAMSRQIFTAFSSKAAMAQASDGWRDAELRPLPEGVYRVTVNGGRDVNPVTDVFTVVEVGTDVET